MLALQNSVAQLVWTVELVSLLILVSVGLLLFGYWLANRAHQGREADWRIQSAQQAHEQQQQQILLADCQQEIQQLQASLQQATLVEQQLTQSLDYTRLAESRLQQQLDASLEQQQHQQQRFDALTQRLHRSETDFEIAQAQLFTSQTQLDNIAEQLQAELQQYQQLETTHQQLLQAQIRLRTELDEREASHQRELANFAEQKRQLSEQFKLLSNEILEAKTRSLHETSQQTVNALLQPFQQSIDRFKKEVQEIHHLETRQQGELRQELASLKALNQQMTDEAHQLATALRGQKKLQGNWGELVLENILDRSGLQLGVDYRREVSFSLEEGRLRPDAVVYLPQEKHLIIDAKVSLNAYTRYVNADDDVLRAQALKEHVQAVRERIKELSDKDYARLPGLNSPEMVFMFVPIESAFVEAMKADETLFQEAIERHVLVATPTTLLTSLNIVRQLWRYEDQNKHTLALANKADAVFKKLNSFLLSFEKIKKSLDSAQQAYGQAENQLLSGRGNLVKQVGDFKNLAPVIKAELPSYYVEKAELELELKMNAVDTTTASASEQISFLDEIETKTPSEL